jgi:hypothetical protein
MSMCMSSMRTNDVTDIFGRISFGVFYLNQSMPFGGVKASGHGRFGEFRCFISDGAAARADISLEQAGRRDCEACAQSSLSQRIDSSSGSGPVFLHQSVSTKVFWERWAYIDKILCGIDYPLPPRATSWGFLKGLIGLAYGDGVWARGKGLVGLARAALGV